MNAFEIIAEPARRQILDLIREDQRSVGELVDRLSMSQPAVSKHLRVLRDEGFVESRVEAQRRIYTLKPSRLIEVESWLEPYRRFWSRRLDSLEVLLDKTKEE
jgi:DNA-binding transcriptional ArsR family regulator